MYDLWVSLPLPSPTASLTDKCSYQAIANGNWDEGWQRVSHETELTYGCDDGFRPRSSDKATCNDGVLDPAPRCEPSKYN